MIVLVGEVKVQQFKVILMMIYDVMIASSLLFTLLQTMELAFKGTNTMIQLAIIHYLIFKFTHHNILVILKVINYLESTADNSYKQFISSNLKQRSHSISE